MATDPLAGRRMTKVTERKTNLNWARFFADIAPRPGKSAVGSLRVRPHAEARQLADAASN